MTNSFCLCLKNSFTIFTGFEFLTNNFPRLRLCLVIFQNKNVADVFQRFPSNANANLTYNFYFLFFIVYFYLFTYFSFIFIDCHRFNFRLKRFTSGIDLFIFSFPRVKMAQDLYRSHQHNKRFIAWQRGKGFWQRYKISILKRRCLFACHLKRYHTKGK